MSGPVPCRTCGEPVPAGRLACPACGTLVASVTNTVAAEPAPEPQPEAEPGPAVPTAEGPSDEPEPASEPAPEPAPEPASEPAPDPEVTPGLPPDEPLPSAAPLEAWAPRTAPLAEPAPVAMSPAARGPGPESEPDVAREPPAAAAIGDGISSGGIVPGAYLPPSTVHRPSLSADTEPPSSSGGWPSPAVTPRPAASPSAPWVPPTPAAGLGAAGASPASPSSRPLVPGRTSILSDLPFDAPDQLEGWLVALGGVVAILGYFLPWTASLGSGFEGYFGSWGLGIVSHLPMFLFLVIVTALAILPNRVATWVRTGVCGMVGGGILFGIVWLYLGSDASQLGALLAAVGAVLLIVGGIIAVAPGRGAGGRAARPGEDA